LDYYRKTSCGYYLERIGVPTLIVNAGDDPFFDREYVPEEGGAPVKIVVTERGGHLGYIFHRVDGDGQSEKSKASWISEELA
jgi:predicted alpha/beta-fold hydrolase